MIKLLLGGSPCTRWSIAQTKNRETEPSGIGWELFENYLIALDKFQPDYFLYENNKSMSKSIQHKKMGNRTHYKQITLNQVYRVLFPVDTSPLLWRQNQSVSEP